MNRYVVLLPLQVNGHEQGEEFDHDFTPTEEQDVIKSGLLALVPRKYRVIGGSEVYGIKAGADDPTFEAALLIENEAALIQGGHIERVDPAPKTKPKEAKR